jgi:hypothetical protein
VGRGFDLFGHGVGEDHAVALFSHFATVVLLVLFGISILIFTILHLTGDHAAALPRERPGKILTTSRGLMILFVT